jgi:hypothetical protein
MVDLYMIKMRKECRAMHDHTSQSITDTCTKHGECDFKPPGKVVLNIGSGNNKRAPYLTQIDGYALMPFCVCGLYSLSSA